MQVAPVSTRIVHPDFQARQKDRKRINIEEAELESGKKYSKKQVNGNCSLTIKEVNSNSAKYDITCDNATVNKIAYKIGNGSYVGIDASSLADTVLFEECDVTRVIYFNVEYTIDGSDTIKTITKSSIIQKKN